jgi:hypothetical protein
VHVLTSVNASRKAFCWPEIRQLRVKPGSGTKQNQLLVIKLARMDVEYLLSGPSKSGSSNGSKSG